MSQQQHRIQKKSQTIRDTIKAIVAQIDCWEPDLQEQEIRRLKANNRFPRGSVDRHALAQHRARTTLNTHGIQDPPCALCHSTTHLTDECHLVAKEASLRPTTEDSTTSIHRAIIHRLYLQACGLYNLLYPRFFSAIQSDFQEIIAAPIASSGEILNYVELGISQASADLRLLPGLHPDSVRTRHSASSSICQLYYSKAFPLSFEAFCNQVASRLEES
jgi:hypothetical protein